MPAVSQSGEKDSAEAIVEKADAIRLPRESFQVEVEIVSQAANKEAEERKYRVLSKGTENTVVLTLEPAAERGQAMLLKGRDLWVFLPTVSQPVRLSLAQRLTGQVANGDLARANFAGDYTPTLLKTEDINGQPHHVLELIAVDKSVTYRRVLYWVRASDSRPAKAEFYSISDRLLKTSRYENFQQLGGQVRPTRLVMEDALKKGDQSVLSYKNMQIKSLPDKMFT
ncbi:MAG: outer membrane lipoprotein-sorting protein, partial [Burkholderiales bacterium]|nr:outer membrane lipoprotein-sorting protein [Burkholderiales bacterium]